MARVLFILLLLATPAFAQPPSQDTYWRKLLSAKEAQSAQQIVDLARALDIANAKIQDLTKQLEEVKKPKEKSDAK